MTGADGNPLPPAAVEALRRGDKIGAIAIVRTEWGIGLLEAKQAVEGTARGAAARTPALPPEAVGALLRGRMLDAIRSVRVATGLGMKEAKDLVEAHIRAHPDVEAAMARANADRSRRLLAWLAVVVMLAVLGYVFVSQRVMCWAKRRWSVAATDTSITSRSAIATHGIPPNTSSPAAAAGASSQRHGSV
jgi:ribosomal protein L7/L12